MDPQAGGKLVQEGTYGCIYIPKLKCKGEADTLPQNDQVPHDIKIDKIMAAKHAILEFNIGRRVQQLPNWKKYYIVPDVMCEPEPKSYQVDKNIDDCATVDKSDWKDLRILRMNYGGKSLQEFKINIHEFNFLEFAISLLEAVALLTLNGICHMDLHDGNVLVLGSRVHLIDFNLAIHAPTEVDLEKRLYHNYQQNLVQQPPDYLLVNAQSRIEEGDTRVPRLPQIIDELVEKKVIFRKERSILGITKPDQERPLLEFLKKSRVVKTGDLAGWFKIYWRTIDSWAAGTLLIDLISRLSLWPEYKLPPPFATPKAKGMQMLRKLCEPNPLHRYDAVQALHELHPTSEILQKYGKAWLQALAPSL